MLLLNLHVVIIKGIIYYYNCCFESCGTFINFIDDWIIIFFYHIKILTDDNYLGLIYLEIAATAHENKERIVEYLLDSGAGYHKAYTGNIYIFFSLSN